jgi:hypothetical protein
MDMLPDYEFPEAPDGYKRVDIRTPQEGDYVVDYWGEPYLITKENKQYWFEQHAVFAKI